MADNVTFQTTTATPPTGTVVSTEEVSTLNGGAVTAQQLQRVIVAHRTGDGTAVDRSNGAGTVDSGTPRVTLASDDLAVQALQTIDNAIAGNEMQVDVVTSALPSGAATAANQASEIAALAAIDGHVDGLEGLLTTIDEDTAAIRTAVEIIDNVVKAEDDAHQSGDAGVMALAVRKDSGAAIAGTDGDYSPLQVDDAGNLRVNVAAGGAGDGALLDGVSGSIKATVFDYTNANPLAVRLTDTSGDYVGAGGGTQYTEDDAAAANPVGTALMMVRDDALSGQTTTDGDNVAARGTDKGELYVKHVDAIPITDNSGSLTVDGTVAATQSGTWTEENSAAILAAVDGVEGLLTTIDADTGALAGAVDGTELQVDVVGSLPAGDNNIGNVDVASSALPTGAATSANQSTIIGHLDGVEGLLTTIDADTGTLAGTVAGTEVQVDVVAALPAGTNNIGDVDVLSVVPGTGATALGKAEDGGHTTGDTGVYVLAVRDDVPAAHSGTDGDYESLHVGTEGGVFATPLPSAGGGASLFRSIDLDESEEEVKATAGVVYGMWVTNTADATRFVKFYNATAANVAVGTTTPVLTIGIPGNSSDDVSGNFGTGGIGIRFDTAITVAATTGVADNDTGAPGANEVIVNLFYK